MTDNEDYYEDIRRYIVPKIGKLFNYLNKRHGTSLQAESENQRDEFSCSVEMSESEFESWLSDNGFEPNPVAFLKSLRLKDSGKREIEDGSWRWIPDADSEYDDRFQLHIRVYDGARRDNVDSDNVFIFAHWEYRWDVAPIRHYLGRELDTEKGSDMIRSMLEGQDIGYDIEYPTVYE